MDSEPAQRYDAVINYSHEDAAWVEQLAARLADEYGFTIWLDKWTLVPGKSWQKGMARSLELAASCVICIGSTTPRGWLEQEMERALDLQTRNDDFRVIPVILPGGSPDLIPPYLALRTWADFREDKDPEYALHVVRQGIRGEPIGRWPQEERHPTTNLPKYQQKVRELKELQSLGIHEEVVIEFERKILDMWFEDGGDQ